jgi:hypothetical protein
MAQIPNSVPLTGLLAPTDEADTFPVTDLIYGIDGLRAVADVAERDAIATPRRREGMLVYTRFEGKYWKLGVDLSNASWTEFVSGSTPPDPVTSFRWCIQDNLIDETIEVRADQTFLHANTRLGPDGHVVLGQNAELKSL